MDALKAIRMTLLEPKALSPFASAIIQQLNDQDAKLIFFVLWKSKTPDDSNEASKVGGKVDNLR